ncbi:MAG: hypothetical protein AAFX87_19590 [Bacteroidota bacterium]
MSNQDQYHEKIEAYLDGELKGAELEAFENELQKDENLRQEVNLHQDIKSAALDKDLDLFQEKVNQVIQTESSKAQTTPDNSRKLWLRMAASISLLGVIALLIYQFSDNSSSKGSELAMQFFEPYDNIISERGSGSQKLEQALFAYDRKEYSIAITLFNEVDAEAFPITFFYTGLSHLAIGESGKAIDQLKKAETTNPENLTPAIHWYLALAYLSQENHSAGRQLLDGLVLQQTSYGAQAQKLLEHIK